MTVFQKPKFSLAAWLNAAPTKVDAVVCLALLGLIALVLTVLTGCSGQPVPPAVTTLVQAEAPRVSDALCKELGTFEPALLLACPFVDELATALAQGSPDPSQHVLGAKDPNGRRVAMADVAHAIATARAQSATP